MFETALREFYREYYGAEIYYRDGSFIIWKYLRAGNTTNIVIEELFINPRERKGKYYRDFVSGFINAAANVGDILTGAVDVNRPKYKARIRLMENFGMEFVEEMEDGRYLFAKEIIL